MPLRDNAIFIKCNEQNHGTVRTKPVMYIVMHYTGNINDTAKNNAVYFACNVVGASAHYFVDENDVYLSVPENKVAWSVGLGSRKEPYYRWPVMWKTITNENSISIEICGGKNGLEACDKTKDRACQLAAELCSTYGLTSREVYRHYDVTGKECPRWAVQFPEKWNNMIHTIDKYLGVSEMTYEQFKEYMDQYLKERDGLPATWEKDSMLYCKQRGLMNDGKPKANITRGELATILHRMNA